MGDRPSSEADVNGCLLSVSVSPGMTPHPSERSPAPMNMSELKYLGGGEGWGRRVGPRRCGGEDEASGA